MAVLDGSGVQLRDIAEPTVCPRHVALYEPEARAGFSSLKLREGVRHMGPTTAMYVAQGIHGIPHGLLLFLLTSGFTLIFGMMGILNLARCSFFMLSGCFCLQFLSMTGNFWLALLLGPIDADLGAHLRWSQGLLGRRNSDHCLGFTSAIGEYDTKE
jgi:hypothetical protein